MYKYRCVNCGGVVYDYEIKWVNESRGEFWGAPAYERLAFSPCCGDSLEEYKDWYDFEDEDEDEN